MTKKRGVLWAFVAIAGVLIGVYGRGLLLPSQTVERPEISVVVGSSDPFWNLVANGARDAAEQHDASVAVHTPGGDEGNQNEILKLIDLEAVDGVSVSPSDAERQNELLNGIADKVHLVTMANDAPDSERVCHVGTDNYSAGRLAAQLVKAARPDGGRIAVFVGDLERRAAKLRRQGLIDELNGRIRPAGDVVEPADEVIQAGDYVIARTYLDQHDRDTAAKNIATALAAGDDIDILVGLYAYHGPRCAAAVRSVSPGSVAVVAFDENEETLSGIEEGLIYGTVVQDPYQYGYEAVRLLASLHRGATQSVPLAGNGSLYLPCETVTRENLAAYRQQLSARVHPPAE